MNVFVDMGEWYDLSDVFGNCYRNLYYVIYWDEKVWIMI